MHFEISRAFKEGKPLNNTQKGHALFAEEPVIGGYRLSRLAPILKADLEKFKLLWPQVRRLMDAYSVNVFHIAADGARHDIRATIAQIKKDLQREGSPIPADPFMHILSKIEDVVEKLPEAPPPPEEDKKDAEPPPLAPVPEDAEPPPLAPVPEPAAVQQEPTPATVAVEPTPSSSDHHKGKGKKK